MSCLMVQFSGCSVTKSLPQDDPFRSLYNPDNRTYFKESFSAEKKTVVTLSANQMSVPAFCRILSDDYNVGVVFSSSLLSKTITAEFKESDLDTVFNVLSRQLDSDVVKVGNTYYIGPLKDDDRSFLVRKVLSHNPADLESFLTTILSSTGRAKVLSGRVLIVSDKAFNLRRVSDSIDLLEKQFTRCWILQLYFLVLRKDALAEGGLTMSTSGTISYNISENSIDLKDFKIEGLLSGSFSSSYADLFASPMFLLSDGVKATWHDGQRVPIPRKTVSDYGTVTTTGYDYIDTGLSVNAVVSESQTGALVQLDVQLSDIQSYRDELPVTSNTSVTVQTDMIPNKLYLLSELQKHSLLDREEKTLLFSHDEGKSIIQLWGRVYSIRTLKDNQKPTNVQQRKTKDLKNDNHIPPRN